MAVADEEKEHFHRALYFPVLLLALIWIVKALELFAGTSFYKFGIYPRDIHGLIGIFFAPLIHGDFNHLVNNSMPFFLLNLAIFYFYKPVAFRVVVFIWVITGILVWIAGRGSYHIGASSLIYGNAAFLFFSGILRKNINLLAISLLVIFLYGSMIWGIFPLTVNISWESHLFGGITGTAFALKYAKEGPEGESEKLIEEEEDDSFPYWETEEGEEDIQIEKDKK